MRQHFASEATRAEFVPLAADSATVRELCRVGQVHGKFLEPSKRSELAPTRAVESADTFVGRLIGTGPGRGVGLMFICLGVLTLLTVGLASLNPRLRGLEAEIPDAIEPEPALAEPEVV